MRWRHQCELATLEMQHVTHAMQQATVEPLRATSHDAFARQVVGRPPHAVHGLLHGVAHRTLHAGAQFVVAHCMCVHLHACMWARACVRACVLVSQCD
jgi:hypothetical protein